MTRRLHAGRTRIRQRARNDRGAAAATCDPPPGLSRRELTLWGYYAPLLAAERRLTPTLRDVLGKYCSAIVIVNDLRAELASTRRDVVARRPDTRKELRQWLLVSRLYENDLLLSPAAALRAPPIVDPPELDAFAEFDVPLEREPS